MVTARDQGREAGLCVRPWTMVAPGRVGADGQVSNVGHGMETEGSVT